jgi:hypothetical protein
MDVAIAAPCCPPLSTPHAIPLMHPPPPLQTPCPPHPTPPHLAQNYVPLFLAKEDLDIAVQSAYKQRNASQIKLYRDKALKYEEEYNQVCVCVGGRGGGVQRSGCNAPASGEWLGA